MTSTIAPPDTHVELDTFLGDEQADERVCHVLDDVTGLPVCGARAGLGLNVHSLPAGRVLESPCAGGCGRQRCGECAEELSR